MSIAGVDIGGTSVKMGLLREGEGLVWQKKIPSVVGDAEKLAARIAEALKECPERPERIGVGTAGSVRRTDHTVTAGNLGWVDVPLGRLLGEATGSPVWVDNDAQAALAAEVYDGVCRGEKNVVYLTLGTGIGGAMLIDGRPWRGPDYTGAELGHIITHARGRKCTCGRRGCFEVYASANALARMARCSTQKVVRGVLDGDAEMNSVFNRYIEELAIGVTSLFMVFKPNVLVLGGGLSAAGDVLLTRLQAAVGAEFERNPDYCHMRIALAQHGNEAGVLGAAALAASAR